VQEAIQSVLVYLKHGADSDDRDFDGQGAIIQALTQQGFLKAHVQEALQYTQSK
jgi:hypothetical protein